MRTRAPRLLLPIAALAALISMPSSPLAADDAPPTISEGPRFVEQDGESLYRAVCQSCHMPQGQGATGAGRYPALAGNATLASAAYPIANILNGRKGMPSFKRLLSDDQIAELTNYLRSHMGNHYSDSVTAADVAALRQ